MPRKRTPDDWVQRVEELAAEGRTLEEIATAVEAAGHQQGRTDYPSYATVRRIVEAWKGRPEHDRAMEAPCRWPDTVLMDAALPLESSRAVLDLLAYQAQRQKARPSVRLARWFWRIRSAAPSLSVGEARNLAARLALFERRYQRNGRRGPMVDKALDIILACEPWRTDEPDWLALSATVPLSWWKANPAEWEGLGARRTAYNVLARRLGLPPYPVGEASEEERRAEFFLLLEDWLAGRTTYLPSSDDGDDILKGDREGDHDQAR